jgi:hypothetical protein
MLPENYRGKEKEKADHVHVARNLRGKIIEKDNKPTKKWERETKEV